MVGIEKINNVTDIIFPEYIEFGTFAISNKRKTKFNKNNSKHVKMFMNFYSVNH